MTYDFCIAFIMHFISGTNRHQTSFSTLDQQVLEDNPVRIIDAFVDKLDLKELGVSKHTYKSEGRPPFSPQILLKLYLYGYLNRIRSSRRLSVECQRNIELRWLMQELLPNYHTIADFRKDNSEALKRLFRLYVLFLNEIKLLGKKTVAIDGSKFRAVNSSKNNYNQNKIDRYQAMIDRKADQYLKELDELDKDQTDEVGQSYRKEEVEAALQRLASRKIKYDDLQQQLDNTGQKQISTTDADSRSIKISKNNIEVSYNTQAAVDQKHNLFVHCQATNANDAQALHNAAMQAKHNMGLTEKDNIDVLLDKGYHTGEQLQRCHQDNITTFVAFKDPLPSQSPQTGFSNSEFNYNKESDSYTCPSGQILTTDGKLYFKKRGVGETSYHFKKYSTQACQHCPLKNSCTNDKKRIIERSNYQNAVDLNNQNIRNNPEYYRCRQSICEHPFGTIKRQWGYTYTLMKGLKKVDGEMNLIMLVYNIKRTFSIIGFKNMLLAIKTWQPDYKKAFWALKKVLARQPLTKNAPFSFS